MTRAFRDIVPVNAPLLLNNGSMAYDLQKQELCFCHRLDLPQAETVTRIIDLFPDMTVEVQGMDAHYCFSENPMWERFSENNRCAWGLAKPGDDLGPFQKFTLYGKFHDATLAGMYAGTTEELREIDRAEQFLKELLGDRLVYMKTGERISL